MDRVRLLSSPPHDPIQRLRQSLAERHVELIAVQLLKPPKRNVRTHSKRQIRQLADSMLKFGWTVPILADERRYILAGVGRFYAANLVGITHVPVITLSGLSEVERRALMLADNKIAQNAGWDRPALATELSELAALLPECNLDLSITGFEPAEVDSLLGDLVDPEQDPADEIPDFAKEPVSAKGDLWMLGPHQLLCGDATVPADFKTVMGRELATMVFTDPPFNVRISSIQGRGKIRHREFVAGSGEMSKPQFTKFLTTCFSLIADYSIDGSIHYVFSDWRHIGEMLTAGEEVYSEFKNLVVWNKTNAGQGSFYRSQHELIFVFKNGDSPHTNNFKLGQHGRHRSNVWTYAGVNTFRAGRMDDLSMHPTVKPVALVADAMRDCSRRGDVVLDPFMGSGTTILAAERVGRRGYGLELDPLYVDATVRRWKNFTKRDAILAETGQTFDEVQEARTSAEPKRRAKR